MLWTLEEGETSRFIATLSKLVYVVDFSFYLWKTGRTYVHMRYIEYIVCKHAIQYMICILCVCTRMV